MGDTTEPQVDLERAKKTPPYELISEPSKVIRTVDTVLDIDRVRLRLVLVTMRRSFLLVISQPDANKVHQVDPFDMIRGFTASDMPLQGLSLALGKHNTTIVESENSLASATLATRLSEKFNLNRPVYVSNNFQLPYDFVNPDMFMSKLYLKIFQFVKTNYNPEE